MSAQFVAVNYGGAGRSYTHVNHRAPVGIGDRVEVETRYGLTTAIVVGVVDEPSFPCKPVTKIIETAAARAARKAEQESIIE